MGGITSSAADNDHDRILSDVAQLSFETPQGLHQPLGNKMFEIITETFVSSNSEILDGWITLRCLEKYHVI